MYAHLKSTSMMDLYQQQLNYIFNRPVAEPAWYWQPREETAVFDEEDALSAFVFIETLLQHPRADLAPFSDDQVALGLDFVFNNAISDLSISFKEASVPVARKIAALRSLSNLFREVCRPRCIRDISAGSAVTLSRLNNFCYMFWDVTPLSTWIKFENAEQISMSFIASLNEEDYARMNLPEGIREMNEKLLATTKVNIKPLEALNADAIRQYQNMEEGVRVFYQTIASVMEDCLQMDHPACIESGLHGLGHLATFQTELAAPIIDRFLKNNKKQDPRLLQYAKAARTGMIL